MIDPTDLIRAHGHVLPPIGIVDVGALRISDDPWDRLVERGLARVLGFEPQPDEGQADGGRHRRLLPYALGDGATWPFHRTVVPMTSSMLSPNHEVVDRFQHLGELMRVVEVTPMPTRRFDDVVEPEACDLLKLDVQGFELTILEHASRALEHALLVQCEVAFVELYQGQPLFAEIDRFLRGCGFVLHTFLGFGSRAYKPLLVDGNPGRGMRQLIWSDALFVRDPGGWPSLATQGLLKLAVLLHSVYGSPDLAARALAEHDARTDSDLQRPYLKGLCQGRAPHRFSLSA